MTAGAEIVNEAADAAPETGSGTDRLDSETRFRLAFDRLFLESAETALGRARESGMTAHAKEFFSTAAEISLAIDIDQIERLANELVSLREREGRLFFLGIGGSAGNCSHAVNDFRKLCGIEAYSATDNLSELTARVNDEGWETTFAAWLEGSRLKSSDAIFIFSVGGGDRERNVSTNIIKAIDYAREVGAKVFGVVGKESGYTARMADLAVVVPQPRPAWVTPLSEAFQAVVWHCLVSHPSMQVHQTKW